MLFHKCHIGVKIQSFDEQKITRHELGRERFVNEIWEWKEEFGGTIHQQLVSIFFWGALNF